MVKKWEKQVEKIESGWKREIAQIISAILDWRMNMYDCQKLQWSMNRYRIRTGKYRIIFDTFLDKEPQIIKVEKRWDVYKWI
jgi:mRNA-degrading endonuclease RelE of RelBE toxin-antitoxin system